MANESTTTTINDIAYSAAIFPAFHDYAHDWTVADPFLKRFDLRGQGSKAIDVPSLATSMGTVGAAGASVDTEFDGTEGTDLSNTAKSSNKVTVTATEHGVMFTVTDNVLEDAVSGFDIINELIGDAARILRTAWEDDICALFASFTGNTVGTSGSDLTIANMSNAIINIRNAGVRAPDGVVFILDEQQGVDYEAAIIGTNAAQAIYEGSADKFLGITRDAANGMNDGRIGMFRGAPVYITGLTDTANTAADVVGACFVPDTPANTRMAALGKCIAPDVRFETDRTIEGRGTKIVGTQRFGCGELLDVAGCAITTDA